MSRTKNSFTAKKCLCSKLLKTKTKDYPIIGLIKLAFLQCWYCDIFCFPFILASLPLEASVRWPISPFILGSKCQLVGFHKTKAYFEEHWIRKFKETSVTPRRVSQKLEHQPLVVFILFKSALMSKNGGWEQVYLIPSNVKSILRMLCYVYVIFVLV